MPPTPPLPIACAFICSFECTFCAECADALDDMCPNCGGELMDRPTRAKKLHDEYPPSTVRKFAS